MSMECEADEGFGSSESTEDIKEFNFNVKEVITNLKCLNGQSALKINGSSGKIEKMNIGGDNESEKVSSPAKETDVKEEGAKKHPLLIGAKVRNSLKELVSRMQNSEKKPAPGDKGSNEDKIINTVISNEASNVTPKRSIDSGNLFENFKINDLKIVAVQKEVIENKEAFTDSEQTVHEPMKPLVVKELCEKTGSMKEESMEVVEIDDKDQETASLNPGCDKNVQSKDNIDKVQNGHLEQLSSDVNISKKKVKKEEEELDDSLLLDNDHNQPSPLGEDDDDALLFDTSEEKAKVSPVSTDTRKSEEIQNEDKRYGEQLNVMDRNGKENVKDIKLEDDLQKEACSSVQEEENSSENHTFTIDRKRPAEDHDSSTSASSSKRSRLDEMIGKLGNAIGISPEAVADKEVYEEDEEDSIATTESAITKDDDTATATEEEEEEETKGDEGDANEKKENNYIRMTEKELEDLIRLKVAQYLKSQREGLFGMLQQRIKDLSAANDRWKAEVKEMQIKINEVTVLQQKHEKRKAATAALRQITTRSVGIQVDESKVNKQTSASTGNPQTPVKQSKTPPRTVAVATTVNTTPIFTTPTGSNGTIRLPIPQSSLPSPIMPQVPQPINMGQTPTSPIFQKMSQGSNNIPTTLTASAVLQRTTVRSLLDSTRQTPTVSTVPPAGSNTPMTVIGLPQGGIFTQGTQGLIVVSTVAPPMNTASKSLLSKTSGAATSTATIITSAVPQLVQAPAVATVKVIDLTVDDDAASKQNRTTVTVQANNQVHMSAPATRPVVPTQQTIITQSHPQSSQGLILGPSISTQIVRASFPQPTTYQIVRSGNVLTVVSPTSQNSPQVFRPAAPAVSGQPRPGQATVPATNVMSSVRQTNLQSVVPSHVSVPVPTAIPVQVQAPKLSPVVTTYGISHPAPFPSVPTNQVQPGQKPLPPKPGLKISRVSQGIVLSWNMTISDTHAEIASYQLFAYQEGLAAPSSNLWKKVGEVKALPLPMACTLTQFQEGNKYHFAVRAVDVHNRVGHFSDPSSIHLLPMTAK
ncbi:hypothetical protein CHS0354_015977 [Potamilus streckersoni]|uniref:Fibronectin type-III domain-containing protein n=1 Tax=Potamilus streckersoni TaxID=2493646 RepID=A0AAE0SJK7_9BIVA|nr:hypothetical protein CHS0354_015977 [Potamilus streckersoni]